MSFKKRDIGGTGKSWFIWYSIYEWKRDDELDVLNREILFKAKNVDEAKKIILRVLKRSFSHVKNLARRPIVIQAGPYRSGEWGNSTPEVSLLRLDPRYANKRLLRVKNPDVVLVEGSNEEALRRVHG